MGVSIKQKLDEPWGKPNYHTLFVIFCLVQTMHKVSVCTEHMVAADEKLNALKVIKNDFCSTCLDNLFNDIAVKE